MNAFLAALGFLTRIPVPEDRINSYNLSRSMIFFPVVGGIIGAVSAGIYLVLKPFLPGSVLFVLVIMVPLFLSGGIHFDGLLDTCDGIFSGRSRERSLEIMRDSRVGSMGVAAGILSLLLRYSILIALPEYTIPFLLISQAATGRWVIALAVHFFPYARPEGLGKVFAISKRISAVILSSLGALIIIMASNGVYGALTALSAGLLSLLIARWVSGKLGGLTGDVYGALNEVGEIMFLLLWLVLSIAFQLQA